VCVATNQSVRMTRTQTLSAKRNATPSPSPSPRPSTPSGSSGNGTTHFRSQPTKGSHSRTSSLSPSPRQSPLADKSGQNGALPSTPRGSSGGAGVPQSPRNGGLQSPSNGFSMYVSLLPTPSLSSYALWFMIPLPDMI
jgi:hypothetical protein